MSARLSGIYGILPADLEDEDLMGRAAAALRGGVRILQLRDKKQGYKRALARAKAMRILTRDFGAQFIVNDSIQLAQDSEADGVHLGRDDAPNLTQLRAEIGDALIVGISCQGDAAFAHHALQHGASYVAFGAVFPTASKPDATVIGPARLAKARQMFSEQNIVAIGGITPDRLDIVREAGADCAAVISSLFAPAAVISSLFAPATDIEKRAARMVDIWNHG